MLTPWGIVKNLLVSETYLTKYYFVQSLREGIFNKPIIIFFIILNIILCALLLKNLRNQFQNNKKGENG